MLKFIRHLKRFIKRLPSYIKLAWKQENWDYEYMYDIIEFKMKELYQGLCEDTWHNRYKVDRCKLQIKVCLSRLDKYRNWENYVNFPTDDLMLEEPSPINKEKRREALNFQAKNYDKFWSDFVKWHQNWWT